MKTTALKVKLLLLTFILLFSACVLNAQMQDPNNAVQLSSNFDQSQGRLTFNANNRDFCDYYIQISFINAQGFSGMTGGTSVVVRPGQHEIANYRVDERATGISYNYRYAMFRGDPNKKPNVDFAYSLPVANDETVLARVVENREGFQLSLYFTADTVFASRGGVVCDDNLTDHTAKGHRGFDLTRNMSQITIYHTDGTFAEYVFRGKILVLPGKNVEMGEKIAIFDQGMSQNNLLFSAYFLDKNKVGNSNVGNKHTHFRPFFQTAENGKIRLENEGAYGSKLTNEMRMQDMSSRERRKFLQNQ
jgi:hypothetical protein